MDNTEKFRLFMSQLMETNATLGFYTDFKKCYANVHHIEIKLNQLNYLLGKDDLEESIKELWEENPKVFSVLDILIAVRSKDHKKAIDSLGQTKLINSYFDTLDGVIEFIHGTGLEEVFRNKQITNLVDYVFGVEVGLDSNGRKNRSGHLMEGTISGLLDRAGIHYRKEIYSTEFPEIEEILGEDKKRFDFVIETPKKTFLIEVNFYSGGGSKVSEIARAYTDIGPKINSCEGYEFVWITDGKGWDTARNKMEEAFFAIPSIYNLTTINDFIVKVKDCFQ